MTHTFHPEAHVIASRKDGAEFVYTVAMPGQPVKEVRVARGTFDVHPTGRDGTQGRRNLLGQAVRHGGVAAGIAPPIAEMDEESAMRRELILRRMRLPMGGGEE